MKTVTSPNLFKPNVNHTETLAYLPVGALRISEEYQREFKPDAFRKMIAKGWVPELCAAILVNRRPNGEMYVIDGQHRWELAKHFGIKTIPAFVASLSISEEPKLFVEANTTPSKLSAYNIWTAECRYSDEVQLINSIVESEGFRVVTATNHGPNTINAVVGLREVFRKGGPDGLRIVLRLIGRAWPSHSPTGKVLRGLYQFVKTYPDLDERTFAAQLGKSSEEAVIEGAKGFSKSLGAGYAYAIPLAYSFLHLYNKGLRADRKLDHSRLSSTVLT